MEIKNNKRIINARPIFLIFVGLVLGIYFIYKYLELKINMQFNFALLLLVLWFCVFIAWLILYFVKKDNIFFAVIKRDFKYVICFTFAFILGCSISAISFQKYYNLEEYENYSCVIHGRVDEVSTWSVVLTDCKIESGKNLYSDVILEIDDDMVFEENSYISVLCKLTLDPIFTTNFNLSKFISSCAYSARLEDNTINILSKSDNNLSYNIRNYVKNILFDNMNEDNAGISYAMLFGKKEFITNNNLDAFSMAGISHILAVSGLHVGVLVAVLYFLLKSIFKSKSAPIILLLGGFLLLYCYICEFSASVVRASIMSIVLMLSKEYGYRYDGLNSLSFAGILILLFNPLSLFMIGFQLSFLCIFSIIALVPFVSTLFKKIRIPEKLASALATSLSVNIVILPVCANIFNRISIISIFANLIIIPLFSVCFVILFALVLFACIIKPLGLILIVPEIILHSVKYLANLFASVQALYITLFNVTYILLFLVILTTFFIHFLMINKKIKGMICGLLSVVMVSIILIANLPLTVSNNALIFNSFTSNNISIFVTNSKNINLIGYNRNDYLREQLLVKNKIRKVSNILAYNFEFNMLNSMEEFVVDYKVDRIIFPNHFKDYESLLNKLACEVEFIDENTRIDTFKVNDLHNFKKSLGVELYNENSRILFANVDTSTEWTNLSYQLENEIDLIFIENLKYNYEDFGIKTNKIVCNASLYHEENIIRLIRENGFTMSF